MIPLRDQATLLALPILTGLSFVFWGKLTKCSPSAAALSSIAASVIVMGINTAIYRRSPIDLNGASWTDFAMNFALSAVVSLLWIFATRATSVTLTSIVEISYPVFAVLFAALLLGEAGLTGRQMVGGAVILIGAVIVITGAAND